MKPIPIGELHKYIAAVGKPGELDALDEAPAPAAPAKKRRGAEQGVTYRRATLEMNKTEARYAVWLELLRVAGEIRSWHFKALKLRLAPSTFMEPDFLVFTDSAELHEVKGHWEDDARAKIKIAAAMYPEIRFRAFTPSEGQSFNEERWE